MWHLQWAKAYSGDDGDGAIWECSAFISSVYVRVCVSKQTGCICISLISKRRHLLSLHNVSCRFEQRWWPAVAIYSTRVIINSAQFRIKLNYHLIICIFQTSPSNTREVVKNWSRLIDDEKSCSCGFETLHERLRGWINRISLPCHPHKAIT